MKRLLNCVLVLMFFLPCVCVRGIEESIALSFYEDFELVNQTFSLDYGVVSINLLIDSRLSFSENMVVKTSSSLNYVEEGKTCDIIVRPINTVSIFKFTGDISGSLNYQIGILQDSIDVSVTQFQITHTVSEVVGEPTSIKMDDKLVFTRSIPVGQVLIFVRPVLEYVPTLEGNLNVEGPAQIISNMLWRNGELKSSVEFMDTHPVSFSLNEPRFSLTDFKVSLDVFAVISLVTVTAPRQELLNMGTAELSTGSFELVSMEPDYFKLYNELLEFNYPPVKELNEIRENISDIGEELYAILVEITHLHEDYDDLQDTDAEILGNLQRLESRVKAIENSMSDLSSRYETSKANVESRMEELSEENTRLKQASDDLRTLVYATIGVSILCGIMCVWLISKVWQ